MSPGSAGTAGDGFRVPKTAGKHRAPPEPPPPDRWTVPVAAAAAILTAASLIALYAPGLAPDATAAGRHGVTVSTAARSARTVSVPLEILPATPPTIGVEGAWDPETTPSAPREARPTFRGVSVPAQAPVTTPTGLSAAPSPIETTPDSPHATETPDTTAPPAETTAAATTTESSATPTTEETVTPTSSAEPTPTDVLGDVIDEVLGTEEVGTP